MFVLRATFRTPTDDEQCARISDGAVCGSESRCACSNETVQLGMLGCLQRSRHLGDKCAFSEQCKNIDAFATCYVSNYCVCVFTFEKFFTKFFLMVFETCSKTRACASPSITLRAISAQTNPIHSLASQFIRLVA